MKTFAYGISLLVLSLSMIQTSKAISPMINYQGYLTNTYGFPLDTTVSMTFSLYADAVGGAAVWYETHTTIMVHGGTFNALLGSVTPLLDPFGSGTRWLGLQVGADAEMTRRTRIASVAYPYRVGTVDGAGGGILSGKLNIGSSNTNEGTSAFVAGSNNHARGDYSVISVGL